MLFVHKGYLKKVAFWLCLWVVVAFLLLSLGGCKTVSPSERIANNTLNDINNAKKSVQYVQESLSKECLESVKNEFNTVIMQIDSLRGRVESISDSCKTEKEVLNQTISNRNIIIGSLLAFIGFLLYILLKRR